MKRYISKDDEKYYTHMLKIINAIVGEHLKYHWLITDIEAYPQHYPRLEQLISENGYLLLSNNELLDILEKDDFQWIWGVFSAIPEQYTKEEILKYELPYIIENTKVCEDNHFIIQHPLAEIEITCVDSSYVFIVSENETVLELFKKLYPNSTENLGL